MKQTKKSPSSNLFLEYALNNPLSNWSEFREYNAGELYKETKNKIFVDQNNLCAYCEVDLSGAYDNNKRIEHFKSKSGCLFPTITNNWNIEWNNLLGVCVGGSDFENKKIFDLPQNLSCDAHKERYEDSHAHISKDWNGYVLNPLSNYESYKVFDFNKATGELFPNASCADIIIQGNKHPSTYELVEHTIDVFNLNCERLKTARLQILHQYGNQIKKIISNKITIEQFLDRWMNGEHSLPFQTTRNILIMNNKKIAGHVYALGGENY